MPGSTVAWGYATSGFSTAALSSETFRALQSHLGMRYARIIVPIDTVATSLDGNCDDDYLYAASAYNGLHAWLKSVHAAGLQPLVSLTTGGAAMDNAGRPLPDERALSDAQYRCGLESLIETTSRWATSGETSPVTEWEVYNEPDRGLCAARAAALYADAVAVERDLGRSDVLVAGAFGAGEDPDVGNHPDCGHRSGNWFIRDYVAALRAQGTWPYNFSLHPFDDVAASGAYENGTETTGTTDTISYLNQQDEAPPAIWITEVGVWLRDRGIDHAGRMLGQDINSNPLAQAYAAEGIVNLATAPGQAYPGQIGRIYYYEFETQGDGSSLPSDHFDSALVGLTQTDWSQSGDYDPARGRYGVPRASYCVLAFGEEPQAAVKDRRCDFASSPNAPWTDWENPVHFPFDS